MSDPFVELITQGSLPPLLIPLAVFAASLLGSVHCAGMCGGLVLAACPTPQSQWGYHLARLIAYLGLGGLAGGLGQSLLSEMSILALPVSLGLGLLFVYLGLRAWRGKSFDLNLPPALQRRIQKPLTRWVSRLLTSSFLQKTGLRAPLVGLTSVLLPCGWLYTFVLAAATTGSLPLGTLVLFFFWLGTLPALLAVFHLPLLGKALSARTSGLLLISAGLITLGVRFVPLLTRSTCH